MSYEEKGNWVFGVVMTVAYGTYLVIMLGQSQGIPLAEKPYVAPMLWTIGASIVGSILGMIAIAIIWPKEADKSDVRDKEIGRLGDRVGNSFAIVGGVAALFMCMAEADYFWIANALYLAFALGGFLGFVTKAAAYRGAFQSW
jgi:hypothetical protein